MRVEPLRGVTLNEAKDLFLLLHTVVHCPSAFSTLLVLLPKCGVTSQITCFR
jgi:hypothetical protein